MRLAQFFRRYPLVGLALVALATTLLLLALGQGVWARGIAVVVISFVVVVTARDMIRDILHGSWGLDILAVVAMVSTLAVGEHVAGLIIVLMLTGGEALEDYAATRAGAELNALVNRAPAFANRVDDAGRPERIPVAQVRVGDELVVLPSELVPVDGELLDEQATIDESSLTGEPIPVEKRRGAEVYSGTVNGNVAFRMVATRPASESRYAAIVALVREAVESKAPMVRLADRYAVPFTIVSLVIAGLAWAVSGQAVRFAEVLVVATPCPLLIAAPVAFMGGMSRAARLGVIVKNGGALELMAGLRSAAFDKTGTLTRGCPDVTRIVAGSVPAREVLRLAAAAEQYSVHVFAAPIVAHARATGVAIPEVSQAEEMATNGVMATLADGATVRVGKPAFVAEAAGAVPEVELAAGETAVHVALGDRPAGVIVLSDPPRPESAATLAALDALGVRHRVMVTGDAAPTARAIAAGVGITEVFAECAPEEKVRIVAGLPDRPVVMVGDGINDAPVLAAADVGIALGAKGATAASESASAVVTKDDVFVVAEVVDVARQTVRIALQSIWLGIGISVALMFVAAFGHLPAVAGAILQEGVDLVAILGALRALGGRTVARPASVVGPRPAIVGA